MLSNLNLNVNLTGTDQFKEILSVIKEFVTDTRVPIEVREEFKNKMKLIVSKNKS